MSFSAVTAVEQLGSHKYRVVLSADWTIGNVPNGGYVASVLLSAAKAHFESTLKQLDQPDTLSSNFQYLRRTSAGPGIVTVKHVKIGSGISIVHVTFEQQDSIKVEAYITRCNAQKQAGLSLLKYRGLSPSPLSADLDQLSARGEDDNWWRNRNLPWSEFRKITKNLIFHHPKHGVTGPHPSGPAPDSSTIDQWLRFQPNGQLENFSNESLGVVVDNFQPPADLLERSQTDEPMTQPKWHPTLSLNIDFKRPLPPQGVPWLFVRAQTLEVLNGRMDIQVTVLDEAGNLIALCSHVTMILTAERNTTGSTAPKL